MEQKAICRHCSLRPNDGIPGSGRAPQAAFDVLMALDCYGKIIIFLIPLQDVDASRKLLRWRR